MSAQMLGSCREVKNLLPLFFDSELDSRQMRAVAIHSARCPNCERELRQMEGLQEAVSQSIAERVDELDFGALWPVIERQLGPTPASWLDRTRFWWQDNVASMNLGGSLAVGAVAAAAALALTLLFGRSQSPEIAAVTPASDERSVTIDSIDAATNVALLSEADTLVLWVDDEFAPMSADLEYVP